MHLECRRNKRAGDFCTVLPFKDQPMNLLISVLITFLVIILCLYLVNMLPIDGRAKQIVRVLIIVIGVLYLLRALGALTVF
jgi:uncharacterized protein YhhL (DUF1145 family)